MDALVASARSHWGNRFTANGVPPAQFDQVVDGLEHWSEWCSAWSKAGQRHEELGEEAVADGRLLSAGEHFMTAAAVYHFAKFVYVRDVAEMREAHLNAVRNHEKGIALIRFPGRKIRIPFEDTTLAGVLRCPDGTGPFPTVVLLSGLDSTKEEIRSTEELFLQRGLATFSVDGPGQGEAEYELPIRGDWEVVGAALFDVVAAFPEVDAEHVGLWGVSLGGYYAARVVTGEHRFTACVALAGPYDFFASWDGKPELTRDTFRVRSHSATMAEAREKSRALSLEGRTGNIRTPLYIVGGRLDRIVPAADQERLHAEVPGSILLMLEQGNHGNTNLLAEHRPRTADWMACRLGGRIA
jgi:2,6-dihydroxypseudooxynicotine hydrolase